MGRGGALAGEQGAHPGVADDRVGRAAGPEKSAPSRMLSQIDMSSNTRGVWNVRPTPSRAVRQAGRPVAAVPLIATVPPSTRIRPEITLSKVVLPEPLGPTSPCTWPG